MKALAALLVVSFTAAHWDDFDVTTTIMVTSGYTTVTSTPIYWTTPVSTTTVTPSPTCASVLPSCTCPDGYQCAFEYDPLPGEPCPPTECRPKCVICPDLNPNCSECLPGQLCAIKPGSCFRCPSIVCLDTPLRCAKCPNHLPTCHCKDKSRCAFHPQTCDECAHYTCDEPEERCPPVPKKCRPACGRDEVCSLTQDLNTGCMTRKCVKCDQAGMLIDPCESCSANEECQVNEAGIRSCMPIKVEPCLACKPIDANLQCGPHEHLVIEPHTCRQCGGSLCVADPCINCLTYPVPVPCDHGEDLVLIPPTCYDCGRYVCVKKGTAVPTCQDCRISNFTNGTFMTDPIRGLCPASPSCDNVRCPVGTKCKITRDGPCPQASCVPSRGEAACNLACMKGMKCVLREVNGTQKPECINPDECLICPQVMPTCQCSDKSHCQLVHQSCFACAHYKCVNPAVCPVTATCKDSPCLPGLMCSMTDEDPLKCPVPICQITNQLADCSDCERDEICERTAATETSRSTAECLIDSRCKACQEIPLTKSCNDHEEAVYDPGSCNACPSLACKALPCVQCPDRDPRIDCACKEDERCEVTPGDCYSCPSARCVSKCIQCDPRLARCSCKEGEECLVSEGSCDTCPIASCHPTCPPVQCRCSPGELGQVVIKKGCPLCECIPDPEACLPPNRRFSLPLPDFHTTKVCAEPSEIRKCPTTMPQCHCQDPRDCIYEPRTLETCAKYTCKPDCKRCPEQAPKCNCKDPSLCILQPRTCDTCAHYYCKDECSECAAEPSACHCSNPEDCVLRPRTCFWCAQYECLPPSVK